MTTTRIRRTASQVIHDQHAEISEAIALMQSDLDEMTSTIHPETTSWGDVSKYPHVSDMARDIISAYNEC